MTPPTGRPPRADRAAAPVVAEVFGAAAWQDRLRRKRRLAAIVVGAVVGGAHVAASAAPLVDWPAASPGGGHPFTLNRYGEVRSARWPPPVRAADDPAPAVVVELDSGSDQPPAAHVVVAAPFKPGTRYRVALDAAADAPVRLRWMLRRTGEPYEPLMQRTADVGPGGARLEFTVATYFEADPVDLRLVVLGPRARVTLRRLVVDEFGPVPLGTRPTGAFPPTLFGWHLNKVHDHATWPDAGGGLVRFWDTRTNWRDLAPDPAALRAQDNDAWRRLDRLVDFARSNRPDVELLLTLGQPPRWASASPDASCPYGTGTCGAPATLELWREYVGALARRYKGRIGHWEVWNEPSYRRFFVPKQSLVDLARVARDELRAVDASHRVVSPGFTRWGFGWLANFLEAGGGDHVDAIGFHWYYEGRPEALAPRIANVRELMAMHGLADKLLWNTEGAPRCVVGKVGGGGTACSLPEQRGSDADALVVRALLTMWLNGVDAYAHYTAEGAAGRTVGLIDATTGALTRSGRALQRFRRWIEGATFESLSTWGDGAEAVHAVRVRTPRGPGVVVWREVGGDAPFVVPADWDVDRVEPLWGRARPLPADRVIGVGSAPLFLAR